MAAAIRTSDGFVQRNKGRTEVAAPKPGDLMTSHQEKEVIQGCEQDGKGL
jgi:hypothetical protein